MRRVSHHLLISLACGARHLQRCARRARGSSSDAPAPQNDARALNRLLCLTSQQGCARWGK